MEPAETWRRVLLVAVLVVGNVELGFLAAGALAESGEAKPNRPHVLLIISDDLNTALSGLGHPECKTPHLDRLANSGVTFTRAFCQFPVCAPSRASIMTGQYPLTNGVVGNGGTVDPDRITLPRHFGSHGYWTARVSKIYHMGIPRDIIEGKPGRDHASSWDQTHNITALETLTPGNAEDFTMPQSVGLFPIERKKWISAQASGRQYRMPKTVRGHYAVVEVDDKQSHLLADAMAVDKAIELLQMRAHKSEPFFLAVGLVRPHFPFVSNQRSLRQYRPETLALPQVPEDDFADIPPQAIGTVEDFGEGPIRKLRRGYYGGVSFMDRQVGRLLQELERLKLRGRTIVVFVSDHGFLLGEHRMWKKSRLWEEAIRVPLIISAPGKKQGEVCAQDVELVDLYPTLTELAGLPQDLRVQGQSLVAFLEDPRASWSRNDAFIQSSSGFCLRAGKWAYMWYPPSSRHKEEGFMLYDMQRDPSQHKNLATAAEYAAIRKQLHQRLIKRIEAAKNN